MKCEGCKAPLGRFNTIPLLILSSHSVIKCPVCNFITDICYNKKWDMWETLKERIERRKGWKKLKYKVDSKLTDVAASYRKDDTS